MLICITFDCPNDQINGDFFGFGVSVIPFVYRAVSASRKTANPEQL